MYGYADRKSYREKQPKVIDAEVVELDESEVVASALKQISHVCQEAGDAIND
jgi:hypothetical protein